MNNFIKVAVLGCTGYTGLELVYILSKHPRISINFLGSESHSGKSISLFDERLNKELLPNLSSLDKINYSEVDIVFSALALPLLICFLLDNFFFFFVLISFINS